MAFGLRLGVDVSNIRRVIHIGVPYTLEEYIQEAERCGRDGLPGNATIHYNSYDISTTKRNILQSMRDYVKSDRCKREMFCLTLVTNPPSGKDLSTFVVIFTRNIVSKDCVLALAAQTLEIQGTTQQDSTPPSKKEETTGPNNVLIIELKAKLREDLIEFRPTLYGSGKTCLDSISLASGFRMSLVDSVVLLANGLTSVKKVQELLPIFDEQRAVAVFTIGRRHMNP